MRNHSIDDVYEKDSLLYQLASYEVTKGMIIIPASMEEAYGLQKETANKFNYFKGLIHSGECTIEFIKDAVLSQNGPFEKEKSIDDSHPEFVNEITNWKSELNYTKKDNDDFARNLMKLFKPEIDEIESKNKKISVKIKKRKINKRTKKPD